jgi:hypothetical protein
MFRQVDLTNILIVLFNSKPLVKVGDFNLNELQPKIERLSED